MSLWSRLSSAFAKSDSGTESPAQWLVDWVRGGSKTTSGENVSPDSAMRLSAVWACVRVRSEDVGKLPCILYRRNSDGSKQRATDHPLYSLIRDRPNPMMTAMEWRQMMQAHKDLRGNAYALKEYDARGNVVALWPVPPQYVTVLRYMSDGLAHELFYRITVPHYPIITVPSEEILHLRGLTLDGFVGLSPIAYHRETIGMAIAAEKYGAAFFGNSARPDGILTVPTVLSKPAGDALRAEWEQKFKGAKNAKKLAIFDGGMKWEQVGMNNTDAQYLDSRQFQNHQIYSIYRVPPHKVGELSRSTNNNIEHQALEYVTDCLMSELVSWEQTLARDLLTDAERKEYYFEFLADALLKGDLPSRYAAYAIARNWGIFSVNDIRDRENMNRIANGDIFLQPLNMVEAGTKPPPVSAPGPGGAKYLLALAKQLVAAEEAREAELQPPPRLNGKSNGAVHDHEA